MSDDTLAPETDDELRARLRALAQTVQDRTDTEAALGRLPDRARPPTTRLLLIAACVLAVLAIAALVPEPDTVASSDPSQSTDCPTTEGGAMSSTSPVRVAATAVTILLIGACSDDDGPTLLARGEEIEIVGGGGGLAGQTLNIDAQLEDGEAVGEFRISGIVNTIRCADTSADGVVILGGEVTVDPASDPNDLVELGQINALVILEGDPDAVLLVGDDVGVESCGELLEGIPEDVRDGSSPDFIPLEAGSDIETG